MLKLVALLSLVVGSAYGQAFPCPANHITSVTLGGNLPAGATNITTIPRGTNCSFVFDIPNNYALLLKFSADFQSANDVVTIFDNTNTAVMLLSHTGQPIYDVPLWMSAKSAMVQVVGASGNSRFMLSYMYQSLADYQKVTKNTGEYFPLSSVTGKTYYTITASVNEKVVLSVGQRAGAQNDVHLSEYYVYDGDNINTATYIGSLSTIGSKITVASGRSVSIVNFYGTKSNAYALGNDASTVQGYSKYTIIMTSLGSQVSGNMTDLTDQGALYTFICTDCNYFLWVQNKFDSIATIANKGYISFQGQTPTHRREKLIRYDITFNKMSFPVNTDVLTLKIGSGSGAPTVDNQYPRDQIGSGLVSANGNYMQVGLTASSSADVRLSFEMAPTGTVASTTAAPVTTPTTPPVVVTTATVTVPTGQTAAPVSSSTVATSASTVTLNFSPVTATNTRATPTAAVQTTTSEGSSHFSGFFLAVFVSLAIL
ncbi:hypothetical protein CAEBREN_10209 [Caenorhabditis brenneri]|uniref:CUB-like domain-containing protein n=1 Tax=Caenorhabditis brenneri TaxID=135651 RepID=G0MRU2_CAEBE|nr:hypothetical protein CAEBREN_10209 [Caenorhabditis brenneri]